MKKKVLISTILLLTLFLVGCSAGTGSIVIETEPSGARVYTDGKSIGTTPLHVQDVPTGTHKLTIKKANYIDHEVSVVVKNNVQTTLAEILIPTLEAFEHELRTFSTPYSPFVALMTKAIGFIPIEATDYWHPITQLGFGILTTTVADLTVQSGVGNFLEEQKDNIERMGVLGISSFWDVRMLADDLALVRSVFSDIGFVTGFTDERWWLLRPLLKHESFKTSTYSDILSATEEWIRTSTGLETLALIAEEGHSTKPDSSPPKPTWTQIKRWIGKGSKQTETFEIENHEWQIEWSAKDELFFGYLDIALYKENGTLVSLPISQVGEGQGSTYVRGAGRYYLDISGPNLDWEIRILDYK